LFGAQANPDPEVKEPVVDPEEEEEPATVDRGVPSQELPADTPPPPDDTQDGPDEDEGTSVGIYLAYAAAAIAVGLIVGGACYCIRNCKSQPYNEAQGPGSQDLVSPSVYTLPVSDSFCNTCVCSVVPCPQFIARRQNVWPMYFIVFIHLECDSWQSE
jgi:hypothetical protein